MSVLVISLIVVGILLGVAYLFALISKSVVLGVYLKGNRTTTQNGLTGEQAANMLLEELKLPGVEVKMLGWIRAILYGNHYNARTKTIYLRRNILKKSTLTSVALAIQKVALAIQHKNNEKAFKTKAALQSFIILAPVLFIPLSLVGIIADLALNSNVGVISAIFVGVALLFYLVAFVFTLINIPVEKKANATAMEIIKETNIVEEKQQEGIKKIYKAYLVSYVADFIMASLQLIYFILKLLAKGKKVFKK